MEPRHPTHAYLETPPGAGPPTPAGDPDALDLRGLEPSCGPPAHAREAAAAVDPFAPGDPRTLALRESWAGALGVAPAAVVPGSAELMGLLCRAVLGPEDRVALAAPCRPAFEREVLACGARYVDVGRDRDLGVQEEALARVLEDGDVRLVLLGRPDVPAGAVAPLRLVRAALAAGAFVLADEADLALAGPAQESALSLLDEAGGRLVVRRRVAPGLALGALRVEALVAAPDVAERLRALRPEAPLSEAAQAVARLLLGDPSEADEAALTLARTRDDLRERLAALPVLEVPPSCGPTLLVRRPGTTGEALAAALAPRGLRVDWSPHWSWRDAISLRVPLEEDVERVVAAFERAGGDAGPPART